MASFARVLRAVRALGAPRQRFLTSVTAGHLVVHWYQQLLPLVLPSLKADLNLSNIQVGTITTAQQAASSIATLPSGYLADTHRRWTGLILAAAIVAFGLAFFLMGSAPSYAWVLPAAGLVGLGAALWHPGAMGALSLRYPDRRGLALSIHGVGASVGDSIAPLVVGALIGVVSWQLTLRLHLVAALVIAVALWRALGPLTQGQAPRPALRAYLGDIRGIVTQPQALAVMAANALMTMGRLAVLTFFPIYIREDLGYSSFLLGVYLALLHVMGMASQPVMGLLSDRLGRKAVLAPSFAAMGLLYAGIVYAQGGVQLGLVVGALGMFFYAILNIAQTAIMDVAAEGVQASTMGVMSLFSQPFTLGSPVLAGYLVTEFGIKAAFWYAAATALLAAAILVPVRFRRLQPLSQGPARPS